MTLIDLLRAALLEDMPSGDVTTEMMVPESLAQTARVIAKADGVFCGGSVIRAIFGLLDSDVAVSVLVLDGARVSSGDVIATISGKSSVILKAERVMLNLVQRLSGIATKTAQFVAALDDASIQILDTRKTTPLLRFLEREAVVAGGGFNHRLNLSEMVLIKENHLEAFFQTASPDALPDLFSKMKARGMAIEIEVETLEQLRLFDLRGVDFILFDNFSTEMIREGVAICREKGYAAKLEVSGNVTLDTIGHYRGCGVDRISVGGLTHSVMSLDLSLRIV